MRQTASLVIKHVFDETLKCCILPTECLYPALHVLKLWMSMFYVSSSVCLSACNFTYRYMHVYCFFLSQFTWVTKPLCRLTLRKLLRWWTCDRLQQSGPSYKHWILFIRLTFLDWSIGKRYIPRRDFFFPFLFRLMIWYYAIFDVGNSWISSIAWYLFPKLTF